MPVSVVFSGFSVLVGFQRSSGVVVAFCVRLFTCVLAILVA